MKSKLKLVIFNIVLLFSLLACEPAVDNLVGPSVSGFTVGITAQYGNAGLVIGSGGSATIRVEVFAASGEPVDGATVFMTATLGALGAATLTTVNGVATTTLTAGSIAGLSFIVATVENASATTSVPILSF